MARRETPKDKMILSYKFRLYMTRNQHRAFEDICEQQRQLYNAALEERISAYEHGFLPDEVAGKVDSYQKSLEKKAAAAYQKKLKEIEDESGTQSEIEQQSARIQAKADYDKVVASIPAQIEAYRKIRQYTLSVADQKRSLTVIRKEDSDFADVQRRIQSNTLERLERAYQAFFRRVATGFEAPGFPQFKSKHRFDGFGFDAFMQVKLEQNEGQRYARISFSGIPGKIRVILNRPIDGEIRNIWFKRIERHWYCGLQVEVAIKPQRTKGKKIALDWGTSDLAVLNTGEIIPNIWSFDDQNNDDQEKSQPYIEQLKRASQKVSRAKRGSNGRMKARRAKRAIERKIKNRRRTYLDKISARLTKQFSKVAVEDINFQRLMSKVDEKIPDQVRRQRNRAIQASAPGTLLQMLQYKAIREGAEFIKVDPKNTTRECSVCGAVFPHPLTKMEHVCPSCGARMLRKVNAARNIFKRAFGNRGGPAPGEKPETVCPGNMAGKLDQTAQGKCPASSSDRNYTENPPGIDS